MDPHPGRDLPEPEIIACHDCGTVHRLPPFPDDAVGSDDTVARCKACGAKLRIRFGRTVEHTLALYLAALSLFIVANAFPILAMTVEGRGNAATILDSATALYGDGLWPLALAVGGMGLVMPLAKIAGMLAILLPLALGARRPWLGTVFGWVERITPWAMLEVYLLGIIVAYVKLQDLATIHMGVALPAFVGTILLLAAADARFDPHAIWGRLAPQAGPDVLAPRPGSVLRACERCAQLLRAGSEHDFACPRCGAAVHRRKPDSLNRSWALLITATILYIPANLLPVLTVTSLGQDQPSTILSGVIELAQAGMLPVALLVFFASVAVPVLKLIGLLYLLLSVHRRTTAGLRDRTRLYRIVEGVGRWSMVDVFMTGILSALVALGNLATIAPGPGAVAFCAVVVVTVLAAMAFDPRLMWDVQGEDADGCGRLRA